MGRALYQRRILLTGASRGIGRALAERLAQEKAKLALVARSEEPLRELVQQLQEKDVDAIALPADVTLEEDRARIIDRTVSQRGGLDVLISNAGIGSWGHFADSTEEIMRKIMEVNFFAPTELTRLAIPHLTQGKSPAIVNVASMCGRVGTPAWAEYSASKHALCGMTEALRGEMARFDIDVLLIVPGLTNSELSKNLLRNEGRMDIRFDQGMTTESVAEQIVRAIQRNKTETTLGWDAKWMIRAHRFFPWFVDRMMGRRVRKLYANQ